MTHLKNMVTCQPTPSSIRRFCSFMMIDEITRVVVISRLRRIKHTPCRTPLNEWPRHRGRFLHNTPETNIYALSGIRTREPSSRGAADLHLRQYKPPGSATSLQSSFLYYYFRAYVAESCRSFADRKWAVLQPAVAFSKTSFKHRSIQIKCNFTKLTLHLYFKCIIYF